MFAKVVGKLSSHIFKCILEDTLDQGFASSASGSGLGALLHGSKGGTVDSQFVNNIRDLASGDVITRANLRSGVGRSRFFHNFSLAGWRGQQHGGSNSFGQSIFVVGDGHFVKSGVVSGIADQDSSAKFGSGLVEDKFAVDTAKRIFPYQVLNILVIGSGLVDTKGGDVATEQLELGGHVGTGEFRVSFKGFDSQVGGNDLGANVGHGVSGSNQTVDEVFVKSNFSNGVDTVLRGTHLFVDDDSTTFANGNGF
mmetsp:Transcript_122469/g.183103  ORF Transcript_122469/g.183103 Transcript_122469/m.183103 type:complete len:253 (-) Transcript_122469:1026-1784(-)